MAEDIIELKVRALPNSTYDVSISSQVRISAFLFRLCHQSTIAALKRILEDRTNTPPERQRLIYRGRVLENNSTLAENSLESGHTIHLVERNPEGVEPPPMPPPEASGPQGTTRIQVNVGTGTPEGLNLGRLVQGVLNAVGVRANVPNVSSAPPDATNASPQGQPTAATGTSLVENVPHLLWTLENYVARMETGGLPTRTFPLFSLAPQDSSTPITPDQLVPLTTAVCQILSGMTLDEELRSQLENARQSLNLTTGDAAVESTASASGASVPFRTENNTVRIQRAPNVSPALRSGPPDHYPHLPLLLNAFANVVERTERLIREKASRSFNNALRPFQPVTEIDESNRELLIGGLLQIGSISHWYAALMAELGRLAAALIPALNGNMFPLALNTASVISHETSLPNFQPLLPRGLADTRNADPTRTVPLTGANLTPIGEVSVSVERTGTQEEANATGSVLSQLAAVLVDGNAPTESSSSATAAGSENRRTPAGMGTGLRPRPRNQDSTRRPGSDPASNPTTQDSTGAPPASTGSRPEGLESIMQSVGAMLSGGGSGEGNLGNLVTNFASNPSIRRIVDNPAMQQFVGEVMDSNSAGPNLSRLMTEMGPVLSSILGTGSTGQTQDSNPVPLQDLSPDRAAAWTRIMEQDLQSLHSNPGPLSAAYLAGRVTRNSNSQILRSEWTSLGDDSTDEEA